METNNGLECRLSGWMDGLIGLLVFVYGLLISRSVMWLFISNCLFGPSSRVCM